MIGTYPTIASAQYNDVCGTVAGDFVEVAANVLTDFFMSKGFDMNTYFPYSVQFVCGEPVESSRFTWLIVLAVKRSEVGDSMQKVIAYANEHENVVPTYRFSVDMSVSEFFGMFKRFTIDIGYQSKHRHDYGDTIREKRIREEAL